MTAEWIKARKDLHDDPKTIGIALRTGLDIDAVVGKLLRVWSWADTHTTDGNAPCVTGAWLDAHVRHAGFAQAMALVGWLLIHDHGFTFPNFGEHNGKTAKQRALTSKRVSQHRNAGSVTGALPEEEKKKNIEGAKAPLPDGPAEKKPTRKRSPRPRTEQASDPLRDAVVEVTGADPKASASHIGRVCKCLREADPPYTPAEVRALPSLLAARGFTLPLTPGTVEKYIGWTRKAPEPAQAARPETLAERIQRLRKESVCQEAPGTNGQDTTVQSSG